MQFRWFLPYLLPHAHCTSSAILLSTSCLYSIPTSGLSPGAGAWTDSSWPQSSQIPWEVTVFPRAGIP